MTSFVRLLRSIDKPVRITIVLVLAALDLVAICRR